MALARKVCSVCKKRFDAKLRRRGTCSTECFLKRQAGKPKKDKPNKQAKKNEPTYEPTPEDIARETALIRSGRLVVTAKGAIYS